MLFAGPRTASLVLALALCVANAANAAAAELLVVVNATSGVTSMSAREVRKLFLGKSRKLPDGSRAVLARFEPLNTSFNEHALERSDAQVTAAWSRLKFSGRVRAPHAFDSADELLRFLEETPNAIAYLPATELTDEVRPVFTLSY